MAVVCGSAQCSKRDTSGDGRTCREGAEVPSGDQGADHDTMFLASFTISPMVLGMDAQYSTRPCVADKQECYVQASHRDTSKASRVVMHVAVLAERATHTTVYVCKYGSRSANQSTGAADSAS